MKITRKDFYKFLFECIVIFISVLAAFIIDNYRNQRDEFKTELTLLAEITEDLRADSANYVVKRKSLTELNRSLEKIISVLENKDNQIDSLNDFPLVWVETIESNPITYEGLKNTGGFKFIADKQVTKGLLEHYYRRKYLSDVSERELRSNQEMIKEFLIKNTRFGNSTKTTFLVEKKSLLELRGNQELINLCYMKKLALNLTMGGVEGGSEFTNDLIIKCDQYLAKMK